MEAQSEGMSISGTVGEKHSLRVQTSSHLRVPINVELFVL